MNKKLGSTLIAMTIIIFMLFLTLGMFTKNFGGSASAEVANAKTSIKEIKLSDGVDNVEEGESGTYIFAVSNTDSDGNVSEVSMEYDLTILTEQVGGSSVSVDYKLSPATYNSEDGTYTADESKSITVGSNDTEPNAAQIKATNDVPMKLIIDSHDKGKSQVDYYILKFTPKNEGQFKFKVKVTSKQID